MKYVPAELAPQPLDWRAPPLLDVSAAAIGGESAVKSRGARGRGQWAREGCGWRALKRAAGAGAAKSVREQGPRAREISDAERTALAKDGKGSLQDTKARIPIGSDFFLSSFCFFR